MGRDCVQTDWAVARRLGVCRMKTSRLSRSAAHSNGPESGAQGRDLHRATTACRRSPGKAWQDLTADWHERARCSTLVVRHRGVRGEQ